MEQVTVYRLDYTCTFSGTGSYSLTPVHYIHLVIACLKSHDSDDVPDLDGDQLR